MRLCVCSADNPEFEFCIVTAKYLIECATTKPLLAEVTSQACIVIPSSTNSTVHATNWTVTMAHIPIFLTSRCISLHSIAFLSITAQHAMTLITDLLHDDDENVEIWYVAVFC